VAHAHEGAHRALDLFWGGAALLVSLPIQAGIALAVRLDSPGPVLHRALRAGRYGRPFTLYKFRTMVVNAAAYGPGIPARDDPRITRVGRILRRSRLDELPQLWNVLRGDMSLVGPRPEAPKFVALYSPEQRQVLSVRPGITGAAQLVFRNEATLLPPGDPEAAYVREILPRKLAIDLDYVRHRSPGGDLRILARTVQLILPRA
jgi:lipopolysaccharide/colanic/teichoic acid biosynthesis glycosyltransferase